MFDSLRSAADARSGKTTDATGDAADGTAALVRAAALAYALGNLLGGVLGFLGPAVTGNDDRVVNVRPGLLLGVAAVNWRHALAHLLFGAVGLRAADRSPRGYLGAGALVWGAMAAMGWRAVGLDRGVHFVMGFAVDRVGNVGHTLLALAGAAGAAWPARS